MVNLDIITILAISLISFILGILFTIIVILCYNFYCENKKYKSKYSYEKNYDYMNNSIPEPIIPAPVSQPISNQKIVNDTNSNDLSALDILTSNKKQFAALFVVCLFIGFYCGNLLLQIQVHH